jgi:hypothetical protein
VAALEIGDLTLALQQTLIQLLRHWLQRCGPQL